jgi:hypothetical protein
MASGWEDAPGRQGMPPRCPSGVRLCGTLENPRSSIPALMKLLHQLRIALLLVVASAAPLAAATVTVTHAGDSGAGSLRAAVAGAGAGDVVTFAPALAGQTILLTSGEIVLDKNLTIDGSSLASQIEINGNATSRVFQVIGGVAVVLDSLTIANGFSEEDAGGGIDNAGTLTLNRCVLAGNHANSYGGAIENNGTLTLNRCAFVGNSGEGGGAVDNNGPLVANQCTFAGNTITAGDGGAIWAGGSLAMTNCTVVGNAAPAGATAGIAQFGAAPINVANSIVALNTNGNIGGSFTADGVNLIGGDPLLATLGNYGGPTLTRPPLPGSPAVDAGDNAVASSFATDQRGFPRLAGAQVDIGAVEGVFNPAGVERWTEVSRLTDGSLRLAFTNFSGMPQVVLASTNLALPWTSWPVLGPALETPANSGQFQFTDSQATNFSRRFYRVRSP